MDAHGNLVGLLTQRGCLWVAFQTGCLGEAAGKFADFISSGAESGTADLSLIEYRRFPFVEGSQLVGQISRRDVLRALLELA